MSEDRAATDAGAEPPATPPRDDATILPFPSNQLAELSPEIDSSPRLRDVIGDVLRDERHRQERTLADVAGEAAVSLPYLSEVERGRKEVSSDVLEAIGTALDLPLVTILERSAERLDSSPRMSLRSGDFRVESAPRFQLAA